ncbi:MAG: nitrogen fixation NifU-like protein [Myxococcota bacterium]|jgi:nitrogen fixation NifU-like protein
MSEPTHAESLYRAAIMDHARRPRHWATPASPSRRGEVVNRLCGDRAVVSLVSVPGDVIQLAVSGEGCAICRASLSMMASLLNGRGWDALDASRRAFDAMVDGAEPSETLGEVAALSAVTMFPARQRCATLAWEALTEALAEAP